MTVFLLTINIVEQLYVLRETKSISRLFFLSRYGEIFRQKGWQEFRREKVQFSMNFNEGKFISCLERLSYELQKKLLPQVLLRTL